MASEKLANAKIGRNDEFYTRYEDIQDQMNSYIEFNPDIFRGKTILLPCDDPEWSNFTKFFAQNFENFGLKKLISTSYAADSKPANIPYQCSLFETESPNFDKLKTRGHGKIFTLDRDINNSGSMDYDDIEWDYLQGDGDFRSDEVKKLRDEADIIITNPPFSLFREFLAWIMEKDKKFIIIGNQNAISYKEVFPYIKSGKIWLGKSFKGNVGFFKSPYQDTAASSQHIEGLIRISGVMWFTNIDHGRRHQKLPLMTEADNIKFSRHKEVKGIGYREYDNYKAIEVPYSDAIPSDYKDVMGVPLTFLDKFCPEQFEIVGLAPERAAPGKEVLQIKKYINAVQHNADGSTANGNKVNDGPAILFKNIPDKTPYYTADNVKGYLCVMYARILIRKIQ